MVFIFGHRWSSQYGAEVADASGTLTACADTWGRALAGIPPARIGTVLAELSRSTKTTGQDVGWPPSLPEFYRLCTDDGGAAPDPGTAYQLALRGDYTHDAVRLAAAAVGSYDLRTLPERVTRPVFLHHYGQLLDRLRRGEPLPQRQPRALQSRTTAAPSTPEVRQREMEKIRRVLGRPRQPEPGSDGECPERG